MFTMHLFLLFFLPFLIVKLSLSWQKTELWHFYVTCYPSKDWIVLISHHIPSQDSGFPLKWHTDSNCHHLTFGESKSQVFTNLISVTSNQNDTTFADASRALQTLVKFYNVDKMLGNFRFSANSQPWEIYGNIP